MATAWIGCSGWSYKHWENDKFYPPKLPAAEFLRTYAASFPTVEINYSYYQLPPRKTFELWQRKTPAGFVFAVKASRYLTHMKKLRDPRGVACLRACRSRSFPLPVPATRAPA